MFFSFLLSLSISQIPNGFSSIPIDDTHVTKYAVPFLNLYLDSLFPEINLKKEVISITEAAIQMTTGFNLYLEINVTQTLSFSITLWVSSRSKVQLKDIQTRLPNNNVLDAFTWLDPAHFTLEQQTELINLLKQYRNINLKIRNVIVYRTKVYAGTRQHVVFEDTNGIIHSVMTSYCPSTQSTIIEYSESIHHLAINDEI
ncbi:hypothetical protein M9Y10_021568 [Tritrichomonas musculus]|uniref:Uncharacterized protein n=1 Tax=Tritrichomonas musculus TaxID=1915356 RepID=A0ABR2KPQ7_9EUKA